MYSRRTKKWIPRAIVFLSILGFLARLGLDHFFREESGLIPEAHPLSLAAGIAVALSLALALYASRSMEDVQGYTVSFPASFSALFGHILAGAGILATVLTCQPGIGGILGTVWLGLGVVSVPCLVIAGVFRLQGKVPPFLLHLAGVAFLLIHAVCNYRLWSSETQLMDFLFSLLGALSLLFFAFFHSAFDTGLEWRRRLTFTAYACVSLCLTSIPGSPYPWLYLGGALWALCDRPVAWVRRRRPRPFAEETT